VKDFFFLFITLEPKVERYKRAGDRDGGFGYQVYRGGGFRYQRRQTRYQAFGYQVPGTFLNMASCVSEMPALWSVSVMTLFAFRAAIACQKQLSVNHVYRE
jgi:hypothetical protein